MFCSIFLRCFCLSFELHFLIHLAPLMHHLSPLFISSFLSFFPLDSFVYLWQKGGEYFMTHVHILRGRNSTLCTFVGGEIHRGDAYIKGEKTFFYEKTLLYLMLVFSMFYGALCSMLYCSHRIVFMCWTCIYPYACSDDHLFCYVVIVVIFIWLMCTFLGGEILPRAHS